jgi:tripartite-type tricarboxylate transporter receptor subunit TctC
VFAPPGLPDSVRDRLSADLVAIANDPVYQTKFRNTGLEPLGLDAAATARTYKDEVARWFALVKARGLAEKPK